MDRPGPDPTTHQLPNAIRELFEATPDDVAALVRSALTDRSTELALPAEPPTSGLPVETALSLVTPYVRGAARNLGDPGFLAHMDPPTPAISWVMTLLAASSNQNLLHPDTSPAARDLERSVIGWLATAFAMSGGHMVPGSTVANLTALWAARELTGATTVVASSDSHLSIRKAASILGLGYRAVDVTADTSDQASRPSARAMSYDDLDRCFTATSDPLDPTRTVVVLTAGTTGIGAIDALSVDDMATRPAWVHVDAAWGGPLQLSATHRHRVAGIDQADSVAISAHKWLYQPKESAMVLFSDVAAAHRSISVDGAYLQVPNVGVLGSHGASAAALAATMLALGSDGIAELIDRAMRIADDLTARIDASPDLESFAPHASGVVAWRHRHADNARLQQELTGAFVSTVQIDGETWLRSVAANPMARPDLVVDAVLAAADRQ